MAQAWVLLGSALFWLAQIVSPFWDLVAGTSMIARLIRSGKCVGTYSLFFCNYYYWKYTNLFQKKKKEHHVHYKISIIQEASLSNQCVIL